LYRYDWYLVPEIFATDIPNSKILKDFSVILNYLDNSCIRKTCGDIALKTIVNGAYYGYIVPNNDRIIIQELPPDYCRSRYTVGEFPAIEFNMRFFDEQFSDVNYRLRVLNLFPEEFQRGYLLYKKNKLTPDFQGDISGCWYLLEPSASIKFSMGLSDTPMCVNSIPAIIDLDSA